MARDIELIIKRLRAEIPAVHIDQLRVAHPGNDDDGLWTVQASGMEEQVQVESSSGTCPFVIESNLSPEVNYGRSVEEVVAIVTRRLSGR